MTTDGINIYGDTQDIIEHGCVILRQGLVVSSKVPEYAAGNRDWIYVYSDGVYIGRIPGRVGDIKWQ